MELELNNIVKSYKIKNNETAALDSINLKISSGQEVIITGETGAGKSTLLNIIGLIDSDFAGEYLLRKTNVNSLGSRQISRLRNEYFGFVFQEYALIENDSCYENVRLPLIYSKTNKLNHKSIVEKVLVEVGLQNKIYTKVKELSGGQRQRVAIARAIVNNPAILIADEPTASLDKETSLMIMELLYKFIDSDKNKILIIVTHNPEQVVREGQILLNMKNGYLSDYV